MKNPTTVEAQKESGILVVYESYWWAVWAAAVLALVLCLLRKR
jgi:hypothetical protein